MIGDEKESSAALDAADSETRERIQRQIENFERRTSNQFSKHDVLQMLHALLD